jgi:hypothetical protein
VPADGLRTLLGSERLVTARESAVSQQQWEQLRSENAPFRVVTPEGLVSAPIDHFDLLLLAEVTRQWQRIVRVVGNAMGHNSEPPYYQVGDLMLMTRVVALVDEGKLLSDGDPWDMRSSRVRLPG